MKVRLMFISLSLLFVLNSCCFEAKENHLGNNIYLSEYDNVDLRILYQKESCAQSGVEIVPMTILEIAHNSEWIIAKSGNKRSNSDFKYWIIQNSYSNTPDAETVKLNTKGPLDKKAFENLIMERSIELELKSIK
ncbi:hypothetical protein [uncultured Aquimarina sp.]|uniref:hypothetical protein n=1 Tax=uncultured Aquimarina sp. TaxID=575652 RepID=UPI00261D2CCB|nr:hypothetical protein [uncultured Aquimarina sp.]